MAGLRARYPGVSDRQRQNLFYADKAESVLRSVIRVRIEKDADEGRSFLEKHKWILQRPGILTELGRILGKDWDLRKDEEADQAKEALESFGRAVGWLVEKRPNTKQAIARLRRLRTGGAGPANERDLAHRIATVIIEYVTAHPDVDSGFLGRTHNAVSDAISEILKKRKGT